VEKSVKYVQVKRCKMEENLTLLKTLRKRRILQNKLIREILILGVNQLKKLLKCKEEIDKKLVQVKVRMMLMLLHGTIKRRDN
jgi:hypothetical protein